MGGIKRRLLIGSALGAALVLERQLGMSPYTAWGLSLAVLLWCGSPFLRECLQSLRRYKTDTSTLITLSLWAAFLYSTPAVFLPDLLPAGARQHHLACMAALALLSLLGRWVEELFHKNTGLALDKLQRRLPATARVNRDGAWVNCTLEDVALGERILVNPGEQVPLDGEVVEGYSSVEESIWTGSAVPAEKSPGSRVLGGAINKTGSLILTVARVRSATALTRIIEATREGLAWKRPGLRLADGLAQYYVPLALFVAVAGAGLWSAKGPRPARSLAFASFMMTLAGACPWTVALAAPLSLWAGLRRAAKLGVSIRNPDIVEGFPRPDVVVIDKKGALTEGRPEVAEVVCFGGWTEERLLRLAMGAERRSSHLLAEALRRRAREGLYLPALDSFEAYPGLGVSATLEGRKVLVGSLGWLRQQGIEPDAQAALALQGRTDSLVGVAVEGRLGGAITFSDPVRLEAAEEVRELEAMGIQVVLASGDRNAAAYKAAEQAGIGKVYAEVEEDEKVRIIAQLQEQGKIVAVIGRDLRDAPALSRADLGITVSRRSPGGSGIDLALESADLVLERPDLGAFAGALRLSARMRALYRENLLLCFGWNLAFLPIAAGALYPARHAGWSPKYPLLAAALGGVSIAVNSLRLRRFST